MTRLPARLSSSLAWIWRHIAAGVAVALILVAFILGFRIGRPAPEPAVEPNAATTAAESAASDASDAAPQLYTCSMHPSVRLPDRDAKCPICFMDLIAVGPDEGPGSERRLAISAEAAAMARIETAAVGRLFPEAEVRLFGLVREDQTRVARLTAWFPGRIDRLHVNYIGVTVAVGDHLADLYSPDLVAAAEELREARRTVDESRSDSPMVLESSRDTLVASRERLRLLGLSDEQIAGFESGSRDADQLTIFAPMGGTVTHLAVREGDYLETGDPIASIADLRYLWIDLEAYESQLPMLKWGLPVRFTVAALPGEVFEGRIAFIEPQVSERTRTVAVRVAVENADGRLKPGMFASAVARPRITASGSVLTDELAGRWVCPMHPTIVKDGLGPCDICGMDLVPAESLGLVGDPAAAEMPLVIPRTAVMYTGRRSIVYTEVPGAERPTYEVREVLLGPRAGELYTVQSGLSAGERVVVNGAFRIDSAMQIAAKPSMMSPGRGDADGGSGAPARGEAGAPTAFLHGLKPVYAAYLDAQEALADDNLAGFRVAAGDLDTAVSLLSETGLVGPPLADWRRAASRLRGRAGAPTIEDARTGFEAMSGAVIDLQRRFGHLGSVSWRLAHCPMAFDNRGADWLQRGDVIDNPYFGASMLRCGDIRETFDPLDATDTTPGGGT